MNNQKGLIKKEKQKQGYNINDQRNGFLEEIHNNDEDDNLIRPYILIYDRETG